MWHYTFYEIELHNVAILIKWGKQLMGIYKNEALKTMGAENVLIEVMYLIPKELSYVVLGATLFFGKPQKAETSNPLNKKHEQIKDLVLKRIKPQKLEGFKLQDRAFFVPDKTIALYELKNKNPLKVTMPYLLQRP